MVQIELTGHGWVAHGGTHVRGQAHLGDRFLAAADLARLMDGCATAEDWHDTLARLNGRFAIVSRHGEMLQAAVDRIRSIPLFYGGAGKQRQVSDDARRIDPGSQRSRLDPLADAEFQLTGYVTGRQTLVTGLCQLQAGEALRWSAEPSAQPECRQYYAFRHGNYSTDEPSVLIDRLEQVHRNVFRRLVDSCAGRTIVVPLSGGYDSRLIGVSLRDLGARDVVCYSYGLAGNWEARISQELAQYLGFRWKFVPYSPQRWRTWAASAAFRQYFESAGNLTSIPHIQDWPAVAELSQDREIPSDSVFVPGHSGDFVAGSHIPAHFLGRRAIDRREFLDSLLGAHYSLWDWPGDVRRLHGQEFERRIEAIVGAIVTCSPAEAADLFEQWDLQERQAKFICNSVRVYEHFGYEWRLPLFDHELMDFWAQIPMEWRVGRRLYFEFARQRQRLPVTSANADHSALVLAAIAAVKAMGLKPIAQGLRRVYRTIRWRRDYEASSLGWTSIVDPAFFQRTYTGNQIMHSYLALAYRDSVQRSMGLAADRRVVPALIPT